MSAPCPSLGFIVVITPLRAPNQDESDRGTHALVDDLARFLETNGLTLGVGAGLGEYVVTREGAQATNLDRDLVVEWARRSARQAAVVVGDVVDVNDSGVGNR